MAYPKLKDCPRCRAPMLLFGYEGWNGSISSWRAECEDCNYIGSCEGRKLDAIREHNRRVAEAQKAGTETAAPAEARSEQVVSAFDWRVKPPEIPSVNRVISYLRDYGPGTVDTTDRYMMLWAADHLAVLESRAEHWQRVAQATASPVEVPNTFEVGKPAPYFCPACQAAPRAGYCKLDGCPTAPVPPKAEAE